MAHYIFVVNVRIEDMGEDSVTSKQIRDSILSNLEYDYLGVGADKMTVREVWPGSSLDATLAEEAS